MMSGCISAVSNEADGLRFGAGGLRVELAFVVSLVANTLNSYRVDPSNGALTPSAAPSTGTVGPNAFSIAVHPCGCFVYVANLNSHDISGFAVDPVTGALTSLGTTIISGTASPTSIVIEPTGLYLYAADAAAGPSFMYGYSIAPGTGTLTAVPGNPQVGVGGTAPAAMVAAGDPVAGEYILVADSTAGVSGIDLYSIDLATGALANVSSLTAISPAGNPQSIAVDPTHSFVYMANSTTSNVSAFSYNLPGQTLLESTGSPFAVGPGTFAVRVDPSGRFVYTADSGGGGGVNAFQIDPASAVPGALIGPLQAALTSGISSDALAITSDGRFMYVSDNVGTGEIYLYALDPASGLMTALGIPLTLGDQAYGIVTAATVP